MISQRPSTDDVCSATQSLAWITPSGATHWLRDGTAHSDWAHTHLSLLSGAKRLKFGPHVAQDKLVQGGWLRVTSVNAIEVASLDTLDQRAWDAWSEIAASCSGKRGYDPETSILIGHGRNYTKMPMAEVIETYCSKGAQEKFWEQVMGESVIRSLVRNILHEDLSGFKERTKGIEYMSSFDDPTFDEPYQKELPHKGMAKDVKRAWAAEADHGFMDSVIKVHWAGGLDWEKKLRKFLQLSGKNEVSANGYLPGSNRISSSWGTVGVVIKGRTTLAANDMNAVTSGYLGQLSPEIQKKYASSGTPKRPTMFRGPDAFSGGSGNYILDRDSFNQNKTRHNEFIVDNWKPVGIIVDLLGFPDNIQDSVDKGNFTVTRYAEVILEFDLPIYDRQMKEIPREKIEAALEGDLEEDYGGF